MLNSLSIYLFIEKATSNSKLRSPSFSRSYVNVCQVICSLQFNMQANYTQSTATSRSPVACGRALFTLHSLVCVCERGVYAITITTHEHFIICKLQLIMDSECFARSCGSSSASHNTNVLYSCKHCDERHKLIVENLYGFRFIFLLKIITIIGQI